MKSRKMLIMFISTLSFNQLMNSAHAAISQSAINNLTHTKSTSLDEVAKLKTKLNKLELELKNKEEIIAKKSKEFESDGTNEANHKIENLNLLLNKQKDEIAALEVQIKNAEDKNKNELALALCQAQLHSSKLEEEMKKLLKDKEDILKEIKSLKDKKDESAQVASEEKITTRFIKKDEVNDTTINLLTQLTNLLISQQQSQNQMQLQMYSLLQNQSAYNFNDYASLNYNPNLFSGVQAIENSYAPNSNYNGYPGLNRSFGLYGNNYGIGLSAGNNLYNSPGVYSDSISARTPSSIFPTNDLIPSSRGFNFNLPQNFSPIMQPSFPQLQRSNIL